MIELMPGMATQRDDTPAQEISLGISFAADGLPHECGWSIPLPPGFSDSTLRFLFTGGAGNGRCTLNWLSLQDSGALLVSGSIVFNIPLTFINFAFVDIDISEWISSDPDGLVIGLIRNSSDPLDTAIGPLVYLSGRSF